MNVADAVFGEVVTVLPRRGSGPLRDDPLAGWRRPGDGTREPEPARGVVRTATHEYRGEITTRGNVITVTGDSDSDSDSDMVWHITAAAVVAVGLHPDPPPAPAA